MADQGLVLDGPAIPKEPDNDKVDAPTSSRDTVVGDHSDSRSSSLSDYDEGYEDHENGVATGKVGPKIDELDSEAETERLDVTPHQTARLAKDISTSGIEYTETPSKTHGRRDAVGEHEQAYTSSSVLNEPAAIENGTAEQDENSDFNRPFSQPGLLRQPHGAIAGRKRKRKSERDHSPGIDSETDKPAEKRMNAALEDTPPVMPDLEIEEQAEDDLTEEDAKELDNEANTDKLYDKEAPLPSSLEQEEEPEATKTGFKAKKGKRKVKGPMESIHGEETPDLEEQLAAAERSTEAREAPSPDGEGAEADAMARNEEEVQRKRAAMDALFGIEEHFTSFRERLFDEKINQIDRELGLLQQSNPTHPEYLLMMEPIDARYNDEIQLQHRFLTHQLKALEVQTVAERSQIHSQYFQTVRDIKEDMLDKLGAELFRIQKERRQAHSDEPEYNYLYEPSRTQQVVRQTKINQEVSLLSGIKKFHGFPAAPKLKGLRSIEIDEDLRAMKLNSNPAAALARQLNEPMPPENRAAEEFFAHTPWANAQHPAHQQVTASQAPRPMNPFTTPAPQRRVFDSHLPNGSGSTIAIVSDPPSSAVAAGGSSHGQVMLDSSAAQGSVPSTNTFDGAGDSPIVYMKRNQDPSHGAVDEAPEQWGQRHLSLATPGSPSISMKEKGVGGGNTADPGREAAIPEGLGFTSSAGVKTENEVHSSRLAFAMQPGHGQGQTRQIGVAAGGFGR